MTYSEREREFTFANENVAEMLFWRRICLVAVQYNVLVLYFFL